MAQNNTVNSRSDSATPHKFTAPEVDAPQEIVNDKVYELEDNYDDLTFGAMDYSIREISVMTGIRIRHLMMAYDGFLKLHKDHIKAIDKIMNINNTGEHNNDVTKFTVDMDKTTPEVFSKLRRGVPDGYQLFAATPGAQIAEGDLVLVDDTKNPYWSEVTEVYRNASLGYMVLILSGGVRATCHSQAPMRVCKRISLVDSSVVDYDNQSNSSG